MTSTTGAANPTRPALGWPVLLADLLQGSDLTEEAAAWAMTEVIRGNVTPASLAGFLVALRAKGETPAEVQGLARAVRDHAIRIEVPGTTIDIVGTGGAKGLNISTMASIVVAATGVTVVKHGNRAASSAFGSADVLERLGLPLDLRPEQVAQVAREAGITFCFAQTFHPGLRHAALTRRELGVPTVFNILAPLVNPAEPRHQLVGASNLRMAPVMAEVLAGRGCSALVVRGADGLDEITTATTSDVWVVRDGTVRHTVLDPRELGIPVADPSALRGADPESNVQIVRDFLAGGGGPVRDAVLLNAAAALVAVAPKGGPLIGQLPEAIATCREVVDSGAAAATLARWLETAQRAAKEADLQATA
jgi:anthranilate phosphoribosyltransferase